MALRVELWERGRLVGGIEEWWDGVELALEAAGGSFPILESISPYGELILRYPSLLMLADESRRLALSTEHLGKDLLLRLASIAERAASIDDAYLRFDGD